MESSRMDALRRMAERSPDDPRPRFGLALEYERLGRWQEAAAELKAYLDRTQDEGNGWGRLGHALRQLGRDEEARDAYRRAIEAAYRHDHPSMAAEFEEVLAQWS